MRWSPTPRDASYCAWTATVAVIARNRAESRSTGTTELLYLVLRLGLALDLSSRSASVPKVLDDVLVNLDPERATAVADPLAEVATEHQMLLMMCRPETRDLLVARVPNARAVELPRFAGRNAPTGGSLGVGRAADGGGLDFAAEQILDTLAHAPDALERQELLEQTGIAAGAWKAAIEQPKNAWRVVQERTRRSARCRLVTRGAAGRSASAGKYRSRRHLRGRR